VENQPATARGPRSRGGQTTATAVGAAMRRTAVLTVGGAVVLAPQCAWFTLPASGVPAQSQASSDPTPAGGGDCGARALHEGRPGAPRILFGGVEPRLEFLARLGRRDLAFGDGDVELRPRRVDVTPGLCEEAVRPTLQC